MHASVEHTTATSAALFFVVGPFKFTLKFTEPACVGPEYLRPMCVIARQLLIDHAFVCSSCTAARRHRRCAHHLLLLYTALPCLPVISITCCSQMKFDNCGQPAWHPGYIQHNESGTGKAAVPPAG